MNKFQIKLIKQALDEPDKLTEWEYDFINSLAEKDDEDDDYTLSEKQNSILNRIGEKYL
jgi:hypothetical protein